MTNIVLIGAGELGSRHLQSLINVENASIFIVEPSELSRNIAIQRAGEIKSFAKTLITFVDAASELPRNIDFAIIATGAGPRLSILRNLVEHVKIKYLVLEKVLFQKNSDYFEAMELIEKYNVKAWVNCPRRMFSAYGALKDRLDQSGPLSMKVTGGDWGLACNAIHFIDIFSFISDSKVLSINTSQLEQKIYPSRRENYIEIYGKLNIFFENGHELSLECLHGKHSMEIDLLCVDGSYNINEGTGDIKLNDILIDLKMVVKYQSELSQIVAEDALSLGESQLTDFNESVELHIPFITSLLSFYNENENSSVDILPIT